MDPFSLSTGLAGLLTLTSSVISAGYRMVQQVRDFESDQISLINEVAQLSGILYTLQPYAAELQHQSCSAEENEVNGKDREMPEVDFNRHKDHELVVYRNKGL